MPKSKKGRKVIVFSIIAAVLIIGTLMAVFRKKEPVISVQTDKVSRRNLTELVVANGKIQPVTQVKISPEVSGEIIELPVKEGQVVKKGDLILRIKPDFYIANRNQAEASYNSSLAGKSTSMANLAKAEAEFKRNQELFDRRLISDSVYLEYKTGLDVARAQLTSSTHMVEMSKAQLARAEEELAKTTIVSPIDGTISKLNSQLGERVVGTATMAGTDVMILADLNEMEARVDIGEIDVVLIKPGQHARLEVDAFKDRKFNGTVTEIGNSSKGSSSYNTSSQDATKFEVRIRVQEKEEFRPGMSITAEIETRSRTNVLAVPMGCVTTRPPKPKTDTNSVAGTNGLAGTNKLAGTNSSPATNTTVAAGSGTNSVDAADRKKGEAPKQIEVIFAVEGDHVKMVPVKIGISDDTHWEILEGLTEGQEIVSGNFRAVSRDLEDGKKIRKGLPGKSKGKDDKDGEKEN
jgi:HlyD family secretion protein